MQSVSKEKITTFTMSKYDKFSREELIALAEKQDSELASKKYGLVWDAEREPEQVVLDCENNLPVLKRVKGKEIREPKNNGQEDNILIEGDNYHALTVLNYTHREKIDVIYIDPPYNTGNQDFKYNDKFVDKEDGFRHSKWLNFMEKRLVLAYDLLKETGVIFISIDDNEQAQLKLLCDKIFGQDNFVSCITIYSNPRGRQSNADVALTHEYLLVYLKSNLAKLTGEKLSSEKIKEYRNKDGGGFYREIGLRLRGGRATAEEAPTLHFPIYVNPKTSKIYLEKANGLVGIIPKFEDGTLGTWRWSKRKILEDIEQLIARIVNGRSESGQKWDIFQKDYLTENKTLKVKSVWFDHEINYDNAADEIKDLFSKKVFDYAKPTALLKKIINITTNQDSVVLDFMAGSGTTGHAVLELNKEDGKNRKFILCTNNEEIESNGVLNKHNICTDVTYPRIQKVIKGYNKNGNGEKIEGLGGNLQYFTTALMKDTKNKDQLRLDLTEKCTEMLCVKENIFNLKTEKEDYKIFASNKSGKFLCVFYNLFDGSFKEFLQEIKKLKGEKKIYMFSIDGSVDRKPFAGVKDCVIEEIPQKIIDIYKQIVKMNIPVKADTIFLEFEKANKKIFEDKEKDEGARILRIVLEKTIQKIAQKNNFSIFNNKHKEEKIATLNDKLYESKVFNKVQWEENKTCLVIGNNASHGDYNDYTIKQVENFYQHIQTFFNDFGI